MVAPTAVPAEGADRPWEPPQSNLTCRLVRAGNRITTHMNGTLVDTETIDPPNEPSGGNAPLIHGHGSTDVADSNFFIRKLTVAYLAGERVDHDWDP